MTKIAVIGDSHVNFFGGHEYLSFTPLNLAYNPSEGADSEINSCGDLITNFETFHLGAALAFNMNKHGCTTGALEKAEFLLKSGCIAKHQPVMCSFGEIDCRVHVIKESAKYSGDYKLVVDNIIANYLEFLDFLSREHPVYVWGPIASKKDNWKTSTRFPRSGSEIQRNRATEYFNQRLEEICIERGFKYFSIFRHLIDSEYRTNENFIADQCHLSQRAWIFASKVFREQGINIIFKSEQLENFDNR